MRVRVRFRPRRYEDREVELPDGADVEALLRALEVPVDIMVAVRAGTPIADDAPLVDGEELLLLSAASGG